MALTTVIGITGGICSGKSTIASFLEKHYDAYTIDADVIAHDIILRGKPAYIEIIDKFSKYVLNSDGEIDRKRLGAIVFADSNKLKLLTNITHPYIKDEIRRSLAAIQSGESSIKHILLDAPLLIEAELHTLCTFVIAAYAPEQLRIERICSRDNTDAEKAKMIISRQMSFDRMKEYADFCINTDCDMKQLEERIVECMLKIEEKVSDLKQGC